MGAGSGFLHGPDRPGKGVADYNADQPAAAHHHAMGADLLAVVVFLLFALIAAVAGVAASVQSYRSTHGGSP